MYERDRYLLALVRYIHLNPVRAGLVKQPGDWQWSGHREYLGTTPRKLIDPGPVLGELRTAAQYEAFVRAGLKEGYQAEWHPGESTPFLGTNRFVLRLTQKGPLVSVSTSPDRGTLERGSEASGAQPRVAPL